MVIFSVGCGLSVGSLYGAKVMIGSLTFPTRFPQVTVCTANMHIVLPLLSTSVQVTVVWLVVVGQMPQLDARML